MVEDIYTNYFKNGTISFTAALRNRMLNKEITHVNIYGMNSSEKCFGVPVQLLLDGAVEKIGAKGEIYYVSSFLQVVSKKKYTQTELSVIWKVRSCRFSELSRAGLLIPDGLEGRTKIYSQEVVDKALKNKYVQMWINNTSEVDSE